MNLDAYLSSVEPAVDLADRLGIHPVLISQWRTGVRLVPASRCPDIERESNRAVRCEDMRPDVDWGFIRNTSIKKSA